MRDFYLAIVGPRVLVPVIRLVVDADVDVDVDVVAPVLIVMWAERSGCWAADVG